MAEQKALEHYKNYSDDDDKQMAEWQCDSKKTTSKWKGNFETKDMRAEISYESTTETKSMKSTPKSRSDGCSSQ